LARALDAGARIVGVNSRNLRTLEVSTAVFDDLAPSLPREVVAVAESGLKSGDDVRRLHEARYDAFLIGERFMTADDSRSALAALLDEAAAARTS
jgi:indole-3-glycerol phosphate synthase